MTNKAIQLLRRVKTPKGWRRYPAVYGANGRVKPGYVLVDGKQVHYEHGSYEAKYHEGSKAVYKPLGEKASEALAQCLLIEQQRAVRNLAAEARMEVVADEKPRMTFVEAARLHAKDCRDRGANEAAVVSEQVARDFLRSWRATYLDEVKREDILRFHRHLKAAHNGERTVANKHARLVSLLRFHRLDLDFLPPKPKYEKRLPTVYQKPDAAAILKATTGRTNLMLSVALMLGLREQELIYMQWRDINRSARTLRVQGKPEWGFRVKDTEERDVVIPDTLFERLEAWHAQDPERKLFFGTRSGKPDGHLLRALKVAAREAGLNCGHCKGCKGKHRECSQWTLHKFRRSNMTYKLQSGIDLATVQAEAGHSDLASTMRYLRPLEGEAARKALNKVSWTD